MQIDAIEIFHIGLPLRNLSTSGNVLETVLVAMHGGGATGWGEASPGNAPLAGSEYAAGVFGVLRDWLAPTVVGQSVSTGDDLAKLLERFRGNQFAKAALDTAWWDLNARLQNCPLHKSLGGKRDAIDVGLTFDKMESIDEFLKLIAAATDEGFSRLKLKFRPGWDVRMVDFVRKECATQTIHIDCEGGLHLGHMDMLYRLEDFMLAMIEQPLPADDLVGHAMVQESLRTPVCLDESITSVAQADMAMELKSCKYVNLKPGRVGGLTPAVAIHDLCHENCTPCYVGAMPQSAIGSRIGFALAAKENCTYPADLFRGDQFLAEDVAPPVLSVKDEADGIRRVHLWSEPGIGIMPDTAQLEKFCLARVRVEPK